MLEEHLQRLWDPSERCPLRDPSLRSRMTAKGTPEPQDDGTRGSIFMLYTGNTVPRPFTPSKRGCGKLCGKVCGKDVENYVENPVENHGKKRRKPPILTCYTLHSPNISYINIIYTNLYWSVLLLSALICSNLIYTNLICSDLISVA